MTDGNTCTCRGYTAMHKPHPHADRDGSEARAQLEREHERALAAYVPEEEPGEVARLRHQNAEGVKMVRALTDELMAKSDRAEKAEAALARVEAHPVLFELADERARQKAKHGDQSHLPDGTGPRMAAPSYGIDYRDNYAEYAKGRCKRASQNEGGDGSITFEHILTEEWAEAIAESDPVALRAELVQVAAVAVQWIEAIDIRAALADPKAAS